MGRVLIIDNNTDDIESIYRACKHRGYKYETLNSLRVKDKNLESFDLIILTGGEWYQDPTQQAQHYTDEIDFITQSRIPLIGICLGMQLISTAFGGRVMKIDKEHHGRRYVKLTEAGCQLLGLRDDEMLVFENHTEGVVGVPDSFDVLAESDECIEMIKHKSLPIVGVQFHPEKLSKQEHADEMWEAIIRLAG